MERGNNINRQVEKEPFQNDHDIESDNELYQEVFKTYYAKLCEAIPVEEILPHLVSNEVITMREMDDVLAEKTVFRQTRALLNGPIWRAISGGHPQSFITLLYVMHSIHNCKTLCEEICGNLNISAEVLIRESREFKSHSLCA